MTEEVTTTTDISEEDYNAYFENEGEAIDATLEFTSEDQPTDVEEPEASNDSNDVDVSNERETRDVDEAKQQELDRNYKAALKEERIKRQELEKKFKQTSEQQEKMKSTFDSMLQVLQGNHHEPSVSVPSYDEDPIGYLRHQQEQINSVLYNQQQYLQQVAEQNKQQTEQNNLINSYKTQAKQFANENTDFADAYRYLVDSMKNEYRALGIPEEQLAQVLHDDEMSIVRNCTSMNKNPAEVLYNLAKVRGFSLTKPIKPTEPTAKISNIKKGLERSKSLSQGGHVDNNSVSLDDIASMSRKEFDEVWKKYESGSLEFR